MECPCSECVSGRNSKKGRPKGGAKFPGEGRDKKGRQKYFEVKEMTKGGLVKCVPCSGKGFVDEDQVMEVKKDNLQDMENFSQDFRNFSSKRKNKEVLGEGSLNNMNTKWCDVSHNSLEILNNLIQDLSQPQPIPKPEVLRNLGNLLKARWAVSSIQSFDRAKVQKNNQIQFVKVDKNNESQLFSFTKAPSKKKNEKEGKGEVSQSDIQKILEIKKVVEPLYEHDAKQVPENLTDFLDFLKNVFTDITLKVNNRLSLGEEGEGNFSKEKLNQTESYLLQRSAKKKLIKKEENKSEVVNKPEKEEPKENKGKSKEEPQKLEEEVIGKYDSFQRYIHFLENQIIQHKTEKLYLETQIEDLNKKAELTAIENQNLSNENHLLLIKLENKKLKTNMLENFIRDCSERFPEVRELYFKHKSSLKHVLSKNELSQSRLLQKQNLAKQVQLRKHSEDSQVSKRDDEKEGDPAKGGFGDKRSHEMFAKEQESFMRNLGDNQEKKGGKSGELDIETEEVDEKKDDALISKRSQVETNIQKRQSSSEDSNKSNGVQTKNGN